MTIEEKAKAYDEALEGAKGLLEIVEEDKVEITKDDVKSLFPELRESEDERIRKAIFKALSKKDARDVLLAEGVQVSEALSYLEKQKEQKPAEWSYPYGKNETVDRLVSIAECLEMNGDCVYNRYKGDECGVFLRALAREYLCIEELVNMVQDKDLMDTLYYASSDDHFPSLRKLYTLLTSYNEQKEQKTVEWSEEDKAHIESLLKRLDGMCKRGATFTQTRFAVSEDMDWLKSLRPQPSWKPSEDLLDALDIVANLPELEYYGGIKDKIRELYKQLKKRYESNR